MFFQPGQVNSGQNGTFQQMMQMMQQGGGMPQVPQNSAPQITQQQGNRNSVAMAPQPQQQQRPAQPGGAVGGAVSAGNNLQKLYGMGQDASNWTGRQFGGSPQIDPVAQNGAAGGMSTPQGGMSGMFGGAGANGMSGAMGQGQMPIGSTAMGQQTAMANNGAANAMGPTAGGANASSSSGLIGGMFGGMSPTGVALPGGAASGVFGGASGAGSTAAGAGGAGADATAAGTSSSPSWLSWLTDLF